MKLLLSSTLALFVVLGMSVCRADDNDTRSKLLEAVAAFKEIDRNVNGELSRKEFMRHLASEGSHEARSLFERLDKNVDSSLTFDEYKIRHLSK